jgi:restriction system protein
MDWQKFEHLIRMVFEKEFSNDDAEVKITQSSRDGGIDAVAWDPDPIKGGKFVIQAKRYTNVVGVSAVRDLYGAIMNEGAEKGILVTTSNYGADSYKFAENKPISLLDGSNLLHLLEKHGFNARIDIEEAKRVLKQR